MFRSFTVKNFRCFRELTLAPLERINLIAGKNNSGKTALLEAIHLHCHPTGCDLVVNINKSRGIANPVQDVEGIARWFFPVQEVADVVQWKFPHGSPPVVEISSQEEQKLHNLMLFLLDPAAARAMCPEQENALVANFGIAIEEANRPRIVLRYQDQDPNGPIRFSIGVAAGGGFHWVPANVPWEVISVYLTSGVPSTENDVEHFGVLEIAKRQDEILPALRILEPRLEKLSLVPLAGQLVIHGDIGLPRLVPIPLMGEGMRRVLSIVLAIANTAGGVVLIDEIENGLHYSVLKDVWRAIAEAARRANVQVFATTHSWECIRYAHEAFDEDSIYDLRLHRIDRVDDRTSTVSYTREMMETALYSGLEMR